MCAMKTKPRKTQARCGFAARTLFTLVPLSMFLASREARGQEGLSDAMANEAADRSQANQSLSPDYTFRSGDFRLLLVPTLSSQWNDNINLTETGQQSDFIILPTLGVVISYPLTDRNLLQLNVTTGYSEYVQHSNLSSWYISSGSGLSFDIYIKDVIVNVHDQFSYIQNSSENPQVAGTGTYGTFDNRAGVSAKWDLRQVDLVAGYDHLNTVATSSQFNDDNNSVDSAYARVGYKWNSKLTAGVEGTVSQTTYDRNVLNNTTAYTAGVYGDWHPDAFLEIEPRAGVSINQYSQTSTVQTSDLNSWYADLTLNHHITHSLTYSIDAGRNVSPGVQSTASEYWFINTGLTWSFIRNFSLQPQFSFQHGNQGAGSTVNPANPNLPPNLLPSNGETYDYYSGGLGFSYQIARRFTIGWNYQFTQRASSLANRGYIQDIIGIQITYHPI